MEGSWSEVLAVPDQTVSASVTAVVRVVRGDSGSGCRRVLREGKILVTLVS